MNAEEVPIGGKVNHLDEKEALSGMLCDTNGGLFSDR